MSTPPERPSIYHITHVDNLASMVEHGALVCDSAMAPRGGPRNGIGMSSIKERRLALPLTCHAGDYVGDYVPFYFCPRSIMLYVVFRANNPDLAYRGGQEPIVHLEADLHSVIAWADRVSRRWAFSLSNAGARYASFRASVADLGQLDWGAIGSTDFRDQAVKEAKQAEFLVHRSFPWSLVCRVGVMSRAISRKVSEILAKLEHRPPIEIRPEWYY